MKTYFTRDIRTIFFLVKHLKFLPFKYQNFVHVPPKYSDVQPLKFAEVLALPVLTSRLDYPIDMTQKTQHNIAQKDTK